MNSFLLITLACLVYVVSCQGLPPCAQRPAGGLGQEGCACDQGNCQNPLVCIGGLDICICAVGTLDCLCTAGGACDRGLVCNRDLQLCEVGSGDSSGTGGGGVFGAGGPPTYVYIILIALVLVIIMVVIGGVFYCAKSKQANSWPASFGPTAMGPYGGQQQGGGYPQGGGMGYNAQQPMDAPSQRTEYSLHTVRPGGGGGGGGGGRGYDDYRGGGGGGPPPPSHDYNTRGGGGGGHDYRGGGGPSHDYGPPGSSSGGGYGNDYNDYNSSHSVHSNQPPPSWGDGNRDLPPAPNTRALPPLGGGGGGGNFY